MIGGIDLKRRKRVDVRGRLGAGGRDAAHDLDDTFAHSGLVADNQRLHGDWRDDSVRAGRGADSGRQIDHAFAHDDAGEVGVGAAMRGGSTSRSYGTGACAATQHSLVAGSQHDEERIEAAKVNQSLPLPEYSAGP